MNKTQKYIPYMLTWDRTVVVPVVKVLDEDFVVIDLRKAKYVFPDIDSNGVYYELDEEAPALAGVYLIKNQRWDIVSTKYGIKLATCLRARDVSEVYGIKRARYDELDRNGEYWQKMEAKYSNVKKLTADICKLLENRV